MLGLQKMTLGETTRSFVMSSLYLVFFLLMLRSAINEPAIGGKLFYIALMLFFGGFGVLSEYLRYLYRKAIKTLVLHCRPQQALEQFERLEKLDLLHGYRNAGVVFRTLVLIDQNQPQALLDYIGGDGYKVLNNSPDMRFVFLYNIFYGNFMLGRGEETKEPYQRLLEMQSRKGRKNRVAPIFNQQQLIGDYDLSQGLPGKAKKAYEQVSIQNLNNRERGHYYLSRALAAAAMGHAREEEKFLKNAREVAADMPRVQQYRLSSKQSEENVR